MPATIQESPKTIPIFLPLIVSVIIILLWLIPYAGLILRERGFNAGVLGLVEYIAIPVTCLAPVIYGWKTSDTKGAVIAGVLPFLFVMSIPRIFSGEQAGNQPAFTDWVLYMLPLCITGGLEGYFASLQGNTWKGISIILAGTWVWFFLSGIH